MTLTFDLATWFLFAIYRLVMMIICAKLISNLITNNKWVGHVQFSLKSMHKVKVRNVTLTFDLATWFLFATHRLVMMIICTKLISNPIMYSYVMAGARFWNTQTHTQRVNSICPPPFHGGCIITKNELNDLK